jgi:hypothetical protein
MFAATGAQGATTLDFDEFAHGGSVVVYRQPVTTQGFSFSASPEAPLAVWGSSFPNNADQGGATLANWNGGTTVVRRADNSLFSLVSLDIADIYDAGSANNMLFTFHDGVSTTTEVFSLDRIKGLQTLSFNRTNLHWFSYSQLGVTGFQIDNLVVDAPVVSAVPEPATWAMMILGMGGIGAVLRTRRRGGMACVS